MLLPPCSWAVTLVVGAALPLLIGANLLLAKIAFGAAQSDRTAFAQANAIAAEALGDIKTVAAFNMQPSYVRLYRAELAAAVPAWAVAMAGLGFGFRCGFRLMGPGSWSVSRPPSIPAPNCWQAVALDTPTMSEPPCYRLCWS
jgi:ATP-binding cassette subfamily B (MDR/TAP) protein 1